MTFPSPMSAQRAQARHSEPMRAIRMAAGDTKAPYQMLSADGLGSRTRSNQLAASACLRPARQDSRSSSASASAARGYTSNTARKTEGAGLTLAAGARDAAGRAIFGVQGMTAYRPPLTLNASLQKTDNARFTLRYSPHCHTSKRAKSAAFDGAAA
jgi:hypothetical protein